MIFPVADRLAGTRASYFAPANQVAQRTNSHIYDIDNYPGDCDAEMVISVLARNGGEGASIDKPYSIPLAYATACWTYVRMQHTLD